MKKTLIIFTTIILLTLLMGCNKLNSLEGTSWTRHGGTLDMSYSFEKDGVLTYTQIFFGNTIEKKIGKWKVSKNQLIITVDDDSVTWDAKIEEDKLILIHEEDKGPLSLRFTKD